MVLWYRGDTMSVQSFINAAKILYAENFYEESLCLVCSAIDAAAAQSYPGKKVTERYKTFLKDHFRTITSMGFPGISADGIRIKVNTKVDSLKPDADGYVDMEQIIYHVLRCGLVHRCDIDDSIEFTDQTIIVDWNTDKFYIPKAIIWGLIAAAENCNT